MLITLWNYLRGYVIIEVAGFSVERFMNLVVHQGVYVWDVVYTGESVTMKVSVKAFKMLKTYARKTKCKVKIVNKMGAPFVVHRYRKRKILAFGFLFFILILYFLSMFVWLIDLQGTDRLDAQEILAFCENEGFKLGVLKYTLDTKELEQKLKSHFPDISWIDIHITGTKANITLTETIPKQMVINRDTPCDIIAKKDGLVSSVAPSAGTPLVKEKDVVKKGDILISGELIVKDDETGTLKEYVHAEALVLAKLYYEMVFEVPLSYSDKQYTGRVKKKYSIGFFDKTLDLFMEQSPFVSYDKVILHNQLNLGENYPLPIMIYTSVYKEFQPMEKTWTAEEAVELAKKMVTGRIIREFDFESDVIDKKIHITDGGDRLLVRAVIATIEDIGEEALRSQPREELEESEDSA